MQEHCLPAWGQSQPAGPAKRFQADPEVAFADAGAVPAFDAAPFLPREAKPHNYVCQGFRRKARDESALLGERRFVRAATGLRTFQLPSYALPSRQVYLPSPSGCQRSAGGSERGWETARRDGASAKGNTVRRPGKRWGGTALKTAL